MIFYIKKYKLREIGEDLEDIETYDYSKSNKSFDNINECLSFISKTYLELDFLEMDSIECGFNVSLFSKKDGYYYDFSTKKT